MTHDPYDEIVYAADFSRINAAEFHSHIIHMACKAGRGSFVFNGKNVELGPGDVAVINQPRLVGHVECNGGFACEYVAAPSALLHGLLPANNYSVKGCVSLFYDPVIHASEEEAARFTTDLANIRRRIGDKAHAFYKEMIGSLLQTMIYDLFDFQVKRGEATSTTDRVGYVTARFFAMLRGGSARTQREVAYYAEQLNVTTKYLSDTVKRVTGTSVSTHINRSAAAMIRERLNDNKLSITQIADEMQFASVSYFSRYCVKQLGMSPTRYRTVGRSDTQ